MTDFIGRKNALTKLKELINKPSSSLVVIKGRRRIGKSRLAEEFKLIFKKAFVFSGLPPADHITADDQRIEFIRQMRKQKIPSSGNQDWGDLFEELANYCDKGRVLVVLDEITWMGSLDPTFLGKLKIAWDLHFKKNPKLILIISGSNSAWIENNILSKTGFFGRISLRLTLEELALHDCAKFWGKYSNQVSAFEKLKVLAVTGGVPRYLEEINPRLTAEQNIYQLCYRKEGILFNEFTDIFADLFQKRSQSYQDIITAIANGAKNVETVANALGRVKGGDLSEQLEELCMDGFLSRDYSWNLKNQKQGKISQYRLRDNYLRFYLNYILPHKHRIEIDAMTDLPIGWETIISLQFENLVINNRLRLHEILAINNQEITMSNPYLQNKTKQHDKCQIDYLVQTKFNTLYLCEIKFSKTSIGKNMINEVQEKINRLHIPKNYSIRPVLVHVNGVTDQLLSDQFFAHIVDFSKLLEENG